MELTMEERAGARKGEAKQLRRAEKIPAVLYCAGGSKESTKITIERSQYEAALREIQQGGLSTVVFTLKGAKGEVRALVKEVQYHVTTYAVLHLDFQELKDDVAVNVNVPVRFTGAAESPGIKLGGVLREVIRKLRVTCLPKAIPTELTLDVGSLEMGQTLRLRDIVLPEAVRPLAKMDEVAVVIAKR